MDLNGNKIIAVDFDGTLSLGHWPVVGEPNKFLFEFLRYMKNTGSRIILNTCRTDELLEDAVEYCENFGLTFDSVNENLPELKEAYGNDCRKIFADLYIDDKACNSNAEDWEMALIKVKRMQRNGEKKADEA